MVLSILSYTAKLNQYLSGIIWGAQGSHKPMPYSELSLSEPYCQVRHNTDVWKCAPLFIGTTNFPVREDIKNILITGGEGFIACWLVRHLVLTYPEYNIVSLDKLEYCSSRNNTRRVESASNFTFIKADITSPETISWVLQKYDIDTIFHFAAQSHVDLSFGNSYEFTTTNVLGTHVMLETARNHKPLKRFIHVSTDEVYGEVASDAPDLVEESILAPTNPYAATKAAAEMMVHAYQKSFKLPVIMARSNNVYGPHQFPEKIIPKFSCLLNRGQRVTLHGDGSHTRRYIYAADIIDAFDTILHRGEIGEIYNIGSTDEISNTELCRMLLRQFDLESKENLDDNVVYIADRPFNDRRYAVNDSKLRNLGWRPKTPLADGLKTTVAWYRQFGEEWWGDISHVLVPHPEVKSPVERSFAAGDQ